MAGAGWNNPFPLLMGGGTTDTQRVYRMLKAAVGKGGSARSDDAIEAIWRQARARAIACGLSADERAALQALPNKATDGLLYYERLLLIALASTASEQDRRDAAAARYTETASLVSNEMEAHLAGIDERLEVLAVDTALTTTTNAGRRFQDHAASEPFGGGRKGTKLPNYSTVFLVTVLLELDGEQPDVEDRRVIAEAKRYLADALPAWVGLRLCTHVGFRLGVDRLGLTALTP
jgi:hypothetical protein